MDDAGAGGYNSTMNKNRPPQSAITAGNWPLVIIGGLIIVLNAVLLVLVVIFARQLGWMWSTLVSVGAVCSISLSITSIRQNNPSWLLIDLLFPN